MIAEYKDHLKVILLYPLSANERVSKHTVVTSLIFAFTIFRGMGTREPGAGEEAKSLTIQC